MSCPSLSLSGKLPPGLRGVLYRNGPAQHERGGERYGHRWDGDGMIHAFQFGRDGVSHRAAMVKTTKYVSERAAGRLLVSAYGTHVPGSSSVPESIDDLNVANIGVLPLGDELLALWEPGSAYRVDPDTLDTLGVKVWSQDLQGFPFSAHPKREPDGTVWNFGADVMNGLLTIYHIDSTGMLRRSHSVKVDHLPPVHDFGVTEKHLVFLLPSLEFDKRRLEAGASFAESCGWNPMQPMKVLVIAKGDFSIRQFELPSGFLFHVGSAWEDREDTIRIAYLRASDPRSLLAGWSVMRGAYRHAKGAEMTLATLGRDGRVEQQSIVGHEMEFPAVDPRDVGRQAKRIACVHRTDECDPTRPGYDGLAILDPDAGEVTSQWRYGDDWMVEEHLLVGDSNRSGAPAPWLVGTALNLSRRQIAVSVFDASNLASGPVAQAWLPYAAPLGLHGSFCATST